MYSEILMQTSETATIFHNRNVIVEEDDIALNN